MGAPMARAARPVATLSGAAGGARGMGEHNARTHHA